MFSPARHTTSDDVKMSAGSSDCQIVLARSRLVSSLMKKNMNENLKLFYRMTPINNT